MKSPKKISLRIPDGNCMHFVNVLDYFIMNQTVKEYGSILVLMIDHYGESWYLFRVTYRTYRLRIISSPLLGLISCSNNQ